MNISREYINHLKKNRYGYKVPQYNKNFSSGSKKLTPEEKLAVDLARPISNYAVGKLISFFYKKINRRQKQWARLCQTYQA